MAGGLINIVSYGLNDLYLTGSPQITFFKVVYRRHTNFSKESISIEIGEINFDEEINIPFPKIGDLFGNTYLQLEIPKIHLLKTETAVDLTNDEIKVLTMPLKLPLSDEQIAIVDDYPTILDFLSINTAGYRVSVDNKNVKNQSVSIYVDSILNVLQFDGSIDSDYKNALDRAREYENSIGNNKLDLILDYHSSDIREILNSRIVEKDAYDLYTIENVINMVQIAINISVKVKNYYFTKIKEKHKLEIEYSSKYAKFAWVERLGHTIIDRIDVNIGGDRIDRHYGEWLNIWYELTGYREQEFDYNKMIGNIKELTTYDRKQKPKYILTIPLSFWFCKRAGLAFPIIALQYNTISLTIKLKKIESCAYIEKLPIEDNDGNELDINALSLSDIWDNMGFTIHGRLLVDYVYLDTLERKRFAQSAHEYLIETIQRMSIEDVADYKQTINIDFNGPCKELIWFVQKTRLVQGSSTDKKYPFIYSLNVQGKGNPVIDTTLLLNGYVRFELFHQNYFNYVQPYNHHTRIPGDGINLYSFALFPEEHQPSAACNFSRISNPVFILTLDKAVFRYKLSDIDPLIIKKSNNDIDLITNVNIVIYTMRYDILRIIGGMGGFAYKYAV